MILKKKAKHHSLQKDWVCEFAGVERWNGTVEWSTGLEYWNAMPTNKRFAAVATTLNATKLA